MKPSLRSAFLINGFVEIIGGIAVLFYPSVLLYGASLTTESIAAAKLYSLAAMVIGGVSVICFKMMGEVKHDLLKKTLLLFAVFHLLISFQLYGYYAIGVVTHFGPFVFHLILSIFLAWVYLDDNMSKT